MVVDKEVMMITEIIIVAAVIGVIVMKMMTAVAITATIGEMIMIGGGMVTVATIGEMIMPPIDMTMIEEGIAVVEDKEGEEVAAEGEVKAEVMVEEVEVASLLLDPLCLGEEIIIVAAHLGVGIMVVIVTITTIIITIVVSMMIDVMMITGGMIIHGGNTEKMVVIITAIIITIPIIVALLHIIIINDVNLSHHPIMQEMLWVESSVELKIMVPLLLLTLLTTMEVEEEGFVV